MILEADCVDAMRDMDEASVDAIVTDPPYGLEFMGKEWDRLGDDPVSKSWDAKGRRENEPSRNPDDPGGRHGVHFKRQNPRCRKCGRAMQGRDTAKGFKVCSCSNPAPYQPSVFPQRMQDWHQAWATEALRVLKPGGHLLAFGGTRTYHRLACAIEDAGFEIRDSVIWLYGSGFPKSHNLNGEWQGWGTALKPAHEPIVVARKPLIGTVAQNVLEHGTGALNVDGCRIGTDDTRQMKRGGANDFPHEDDNWVPKDIVGGSECGRWPANVALSHLPECEPDAAQPHDVLARTCAEGCPVAGLDRQSGERSSSGGRVSDSGMFAMQAQPEVDTGYGDTGGASRFFYVAKASRAERNAGLDGFEQHEGPSGDYGTKRVNLTRRDGGPNEVKPTTNLHPTVKPIDLMRWLVRLVTPPGGTILDPFCGSGTTGIAATLEGFSFIGIERDAEYCEIARARIAWWERHPEGMELVQRLNAEVERKAIVDAGQLELL